MTTETRPVHVFGPDEFVECPCCFERPPNDLLGHEHAVYVDDDGPVFEGTCPTCGKFLWQEGEDFE